MLCLFFFKQKTAYELRISDWSADVCSSDLRAFEFFADRGGSVGQTASGEHEAARSRPDGEVARFDARGAHLRAEQLFQLGTRAGLHPRRDFLAARSEEHTSELQSLMRSSYAVFCLKKKNTSIYTTLTNHNNNKS